MYLSKEVQLETVNCLTVDTAALTVLTHLIQSETAGFSRKNDLARPGFRPSRSRVSDRIFTYPAYSSKLF